MAEERGAGREPQSQGDPDPGQAQRVEAQDQRRHRNVGQDGEDHRAAHGDVVGEAEDEAVEDERQGGQGLGQGRDLQATVAACRTARSEVNRAGTRTPAPR